QLSAPLFPYTTLFRSYLTTVLTAVKERLTYVSDFWGQASFFFEEPTQYDVDAVKPKWNADKTAFFENIISEFENQTDWTAVSLEDRKSTRLNSSHVKI